MYSTDILEIFLLFNPPRYRWAKEDINNNVVDKSRIFLFMMIGLIHLAIAFICFLYVFCINGINRGILENFIYGILAIFVPWILFLLSIVRCLFFNINLFKDLSPYTKQNKNILIIGIFISFLPVLNIFLTMFIYFYNIKKINKWEFKYTWNMWNHRWKFSFKKGFYKR